MASLVLGQNGIWGDLLGVSEGDPIHRQHVGSYKKVREAITESDPVVTGLVGGSPEIHEKISALSGKGVVVIFATLGGPLFVCDAAQGGRQYWASEGVKVASTPPPTPASAFDFANPGQSSCSSEWSEG